LPLVHTFTRSPELDADFGDAISCRTAAGGFKIQEGERGGFQVLNSLRHFTTLIPNAAAC